MKNFKLNGKDIELVDLDFNEACIFEEHGVPLTEVKGKPFSALRLYFALCANISEESAGKEIQAHIMKTHDINELYDIFGKKLDESDFFQALNQGEEQETPESKEKERKEK